MFYDEDTKMVYLAVKVRNNSLTTKILNNSLTTLTH